MCGHKLMIIWARMTADGLEITWGENTEVPKLNMYHLYYNHH